MNKKGFTIVELLLVVVIISIVVAIALPSIFNIIGENKIRGYEEYGKNIKENLEMYNIDLKEDLWYDDSLSYVNVSKEMLKSRNKDLDINNKSCLIAGDMRIIKNGNSFTYEVCIYCGENEDGAHSYNGLNYDYESSDCK